MKRVRLKERSERHTEGLASRRGPTSPKHRERHPTGGTPKHSGRSRPDIPSPMQFYQHLSWIDGRAEVVE